jgi:hypothetical protein
MPVEDASWHRSSSLSSEVQEVPSAVVEETIVAPRQYLATLLSQKAKVLAWMREPLAVELSVEDLVVDPRADSLTVVRKHYMESPLQPHLLFSVADQPQIQRRGRQGYTVEKRAESAKAFYAQLRPCWRGPELAQHCLPAELLDMGPMLHQLAKGRDRLGALLGPSIQ